VSIAVHIATLALIAEGTARTVQAALPHPPFTRSVDDEEVAMALLAAVMLVYVLCMIVATAIVHVVYRLAGALL
jgi:hypothetical protein